MPIAHVIRPSRLPCEANLQEVIEEIGHIDIIIKIRFMENPMGGVIRWPEYGQGSIRANAKINGKKQQRLDDAGITSTTLTYFYPSEEIIITPRQDTWAITSSTLQAFLHPVSKP